MVQDVIKLILIIIARLVFMVVGKAVASLLNQAHVVTCIFRKVCIIYTVKLQYSRETPDSEMVSNKILQISLYSFLRALILCLAT